MIRSTITFAMLALLAPFSGEAQTIVITRAESRSVRPGPAGNFTGDVLVEMLSEAAEPSDASVGSVTFAPGARTAWHSHPRGQVLIITAGTGRVQQWGEPGRDVRVGDAVRILAGVKHWHGASPQTPMTHIAVTEDHDGTRVQWMEPVSDEQYRDSASSGTGTERAPAAGEPQERQQQRANQTQTERRPSGPVQQRIAPGLAALTDDVLYGDVWRRPDLSPRDRSLVTIAVLIATGKPAQLPGHLGRALDNGLEPREASGVLAQLAIYSGWPNAVSALAVYDQVYTARKIDTGALHTRAGRLQAPPSDAARARALAEQMGSTASKFVQLTNDVVFDDLWRRPDLSVRDRSLVTIAALAAMGDDDQLDLYVQRGLESGLTRAQVTEALTHVGFYAGWPKASKALMAVTSMLGK